MKIGQSSTDLVRTYLREIGKVPLLTHEQEIVLGKQVQRLTSLQQLKQELAENYLENPLMKNGRSPQKLPKPTCLKRSPKVKLPSEKWWKRICA